MLMLFSLLVLLLIEAFKFSVVHPNAIGSFYEIVPEVDIAGFREGSFLGIKVAQLVLLPGKAGETSHSVIVREVMDIADFSDNTGGEDQAHTWYG